jgi:hypothetical protein
MKISRLVPMVSMLLAGVLATPAFADISTGGGGGGGGCSVGGTDVASTLAGVGVFGLGYVALKLSRRNRKG